MARIETLAQLIQKIQADRQKAEGLDASLARMERSLRRLRLLAGLAVNH